MSDGEKILTLTKLLANPREFHAIQHTTAIKLVCGALHDRDHMTIADNQSSMPHSRFASGRGKAPTTDFLRAPASAEATADKPEAA